MREIKQLPKIYDHPCHNNFKELIDYSAENFSESDAFIIKHKQGKEVSYRHITYSTFRSQIDALGSGMMKSGFDNKRVAIIGKNRYEWILSYFSVLCGLGTCIPLDKGLPFDEAESSLIRSYADILIFDRDHKELVDELKEKGNTGITNYICMESLDGFTSISDLLDRGESAIKDGFTGYKDKEVDGDAVSIYLFTSGTTSMSKAVMLSQKNITTNTYAALVSEDIFHGDVNMAFLPYHHTFGSTGQIVMLAAGAVTTYCDGLKYLQKNIVEYKVTIFVCVPLLIESIYKKIMIQVKKQGKEKKVIFAMKISKFLLKLGIDVRRKLFKEILDQLGGNLRYVISGASAIDPEALEGFNAFGIDSVQGYGMTEASPMLAAENPKNRKTGSIGRAMPGVQLQVVDANDEGIGELIAKGPNIMAGYYQNPEETAKVLQDGWLHTGDLVSVDDDGYIFIRGRKKNVIVLKNGKNIYPEEIELLISNLPYVEENMIFGQPRHKDGDHKDLAICAKIVYKSDYMKDMYGTDNVEEIEKIIKNDIDIINDELPTYKHVLRLIVTDQPMIKTTTGKVKRFEETKNM